MRELLPLDDGRFLVVNSNSIIITADELTDKELKNVEKKCKTCGIRGTKNEVIKETSAVADTDNVGE